MERNGWLLGIISVLFLLGVAMPASAQVAGSPACTVYRDTGQNLPSGLYRLCVAGDSIVVDHNTAATGNFSTFTRSAVASGAALDCSSQAGSSASIKIAACAGVLQGTGGGVADARNLTGAQVWNTDAFSGITVPIDFYCGATTYTVSATSTIVSNVHLVPGAGCTFSVNAGVTLTISGPVDGSFLPTFTGAGTVNGAFPNQLIIQASLTNPGIFYGTSGGKNVTNLAADPVTGILQMQPVGNGMTSSLHAQVTSGTLPVGTLSEFVITRTQSQAFGGNYSRYSFSSIAGGGTPPTVPNVDGLFIEAGGTSQSNSQLVTPWLVSIGIENPGGVFTSYEPFRFLTGADTGNVGFGVMVAGATARNVVQIYGPQLSGAGTADGNSLEYFGYSFDTMQHAVNWRENVHPTTNAGASYWRLQNRVDNAAFLDMFDCNSAGQCLIGASADMTVNDYASGQGKLFGLGGVTASNNVTNSSMIRMQSFGGVSGFHVIGSDASGTGRGEPIVFAMCTGGACVNGLNGGTQIMQMGIRDTNGGGVLIGATGTVPPTGGLTTMGAVTFNGLTSSGAQDYLCFNTATSAVVQGTAPCTASSERYKHDFELLDGGLDIVLKLPTYSYVRNDHPEIGRMVGLKAEDVFAIDPRLVGLDEQGRPDRVRYDTYTAVLTKAIQELESRVHKIESKE